MRPDRVSLWALRRRRRTRVQVHLHLVSFLVLLQRAVAVLQTSKTRLVLLPPRVNGLHHLLVGTRSGRVTQPAPREVLRHLSAPMELAVHGTLVHRLLLLLRTQVSMSLRLLVHLTTARNILVQCLRLRTKRHNISTHMLLQGNPQIPLTSPLPILISTPSHIDLPSSKTRPILRQDPATRSIPPHHMCHIITSMYGLLHILRLDLYLYQYPRARHLRRVPLW